MSNKTCDTCKWWNEEESPYANMGVCKLSQEDNPYMVAQDEIQAYYPYLETSKDFGCNQHTSNQS